MVSAAPVQDILQRSQNSEQVFPLIEHYTFCLAGAYGIGHFRSSSNAAFVQGFQYLCRPYYRDVSGFTQPKDFLLNFTLSYLAITNPEGFVRLQMFQF
jgi:hypothetical protein